MNRLLGQIEKIDDPVTRAAFLLDALSKFYI